MRSTLLGVLIALSPSWAFAQQPQNPYPQQQQAPPQQTQQAPPQQQYPYYRPPQAPYPSYPAPLQQPRAVAAPPAPAPARLTLATRSMEVAQLVTTCANAVDNYHLDVARKKCGEAVAKEDGL